jgi:hypothetical protein
MNTGQTSNVQKVSMGDGEFESAQRVLKYLNHLYQPTATSSADSSYLLS